MYASDNNSFVLPVKMLDKELHSSVEAIWYEIIAGKSLLGGNNANSPDNLSASRKVLVCPSDRRKNNALNYVRNVRLSYGMNPAMGQVPANGARAFMKVGQFSRNMAIATVFADNWGYFAADEAGREGELLTGSWGIYILTNIVRLSVGEQRAHSGGAAQSYADGHAAIMPGIYMYTRAPGDVNSWWNMVNVWDAAPDGSNLRYVKQCF